MQIKGHTGDTPVFCVFSDIVNIDDVKPNPDNPNQHGDDQVELLGRIIKRQGWRAPITVSTLSGYVVRGHGRLMAARAAGLTQVPVDYQHYDTAAEELADLVADNRLSELSQIDNQKLAAMFSEIDGDMIDECVTGYSREEIDEINDAISRSMDDMGEIDSIKQGRERAEHVLTIDKMKIQLTDEEYKKFTNEIDTYVSINGVTFGFVGWLLDGD